MSDPYDGKPHYCVTCGEQHDQACTDNCELESEAAAVARARKRRPKTSDLAQFTPPEL